MLQSSPEPRFRPELLQTGLKSSPRFGIVPKLNWKSSSRFGRGPNVVNPVQTELDPKPEGIHSSNCHASCPTPIVLLFSYTVLLSGTLMQLCHLTIWHLAPCMGRSFALSVGRILTQLQLHCLRVVPSHCLQVTPCTICNPPYHVQHSLSASITLS